MCCLLWTCQDHHTNAKYAVPEIIPIHPMEDHQNHRRGRGVLKVTILEAKYEAKLEFPGGGGVGGVKQKTFCGGSMDIFWSCTIREAMFEAKLELSGGGGGGWGVQNQKPSMGGVWKFPGTAQWLNE